MDERNPDYPPSNVWDNCEHDWKEIESMSDRDVKCRKCGAPGERQGGLWVYWPAT